MLVRAHPLPGPLRNGVSAAAGRLHYIPHQAAHPVGQDVLHRHQQPAPCLVQPQAHGVVARLLPRIRFPALVRVEIQRLLVQHHRLPGEETPRLLDEPLRRLPIRCEEGQHVLMPARAAAALGEQVAGRVQGGAAGVPVRVHRAGGEDHEPHRRLVRHVGRRRRAGVHALEAAPIPPGRFAQPPLDLPLHLVLGELLRPLRDGAAQIRAGVVPVAAVLAVEVGQPLGELRQRVVEHRHLLPRLHRAQADAHVLRI